MTKPPQVRSPNFNGATASPVRRQTVGSAIPPVQFVPPDVPPVTDAPQPPASKKKVWIVAGIISGIIILAGFGAFWRFGLMNLQAPWRRATYLPAASRTI